VSQLPPIPYEVLTVSATFPEYGPDVYDALAAAWPHLYAAALRHAADLVHDPDAELVLLRLAEEVTP
jgi:hypothetical protein